MESPRERVAKAEAFGWCRLQRDHIQIFIWISPFLRKFADVQRDLVGGLIYTQNIIDSMFLSDLETMLMFVLNNKITSVQKMV